MAKAIAENTKDLCRLICLSDYRRAGAAMLPNVIEDGEPAFPPRTFPGSDYDLISRDIATTARLLRAGLATTEGLASYLDRLSVSAKLACHSARELKDRALRAERQLEKAPAKPQ